MCPRCCQRESIVLRQKHSRLQNLGSMGGSRDFKGGVHNQRYTCHTNKVKLVVIVRSTISMRSMLILGHAPPGKFLKIDALRWYLGAFLSVC